MILGSIQLKNRVYLLVNLPPSFPAEMPGQGGNPPPPPKKRGAKIAKIEAETFATATQAPQIFWPNYGPLMFSGNIHNNFFFTDQNLL